MNIPSDMKAIEMSGAGGPEVLTLAQRAVPQPNGTQVLVKVTAAGVNGPDLMQRRGLYPAPKGATDLLGLEIAGEVVATGDKVTRWSVGDSLCGLTNGGGYAEYCVVDDNHCLPVPKNMSAVDAASLPETYFTIWSNIFMGAALKSGEVFLVHGGAGGLGSTSIQLGKAFGATVIATDSPAKRCEFCEQLGADLVIDYNDGDYVSIVREQFGGADVILDIVGGANIEKNIKAARHNARIVQLAFALGSKVEINFMPIMLKRISYTGSTLRSRSDESKSDIRQDLQTKVWPLMNEGKLRAVVDTVLPLDQAAKAHELMESAAHTGKIVLQVS